jgi:hypothetical protein
MVASMLLNGFAPAIEPVEPRKDHLLHVSFIGSNVKYSAMAIPARSRACAACPAISANHTFGELKARKIFASSGRSTSK